MLHFVSKPFPFGKRYPIFNNCGLYQPKIEQMENIDKSFSFADFIGVVHSGIDGEDKKGVYLPDTDEIVSGYTSLLSHFSLKPFVSEDFNQARIHIRHAINSSKTLNLVIEKIIHLCRQYLSPDLEVKVTGSSYLNSLADD